MDQLKVLHIFPEFKRGGAQINVLRFIKSSKGDFRHFTAAGPFNASLEEEYRLHTEEVFPIDMTKVRISSIFRLAGLIISLKPDIVHVNGKGAAFYGFITSYFTGKKYRIYHTMRGFHIKYSGWKLNLYLLFEKMAARRFDGNILVSPSEKKLLIKSIPGLDPKKLFLIPNGIEVDSHIPLPSEMETAVHKGKVNIVTLSRLSHQKDLITMLEAFDRVCLTSPDISLHILGGETPQDKAYADRVRRRLEESPNRERIYLWGSVENAGSLIGHFDIYWTTALFEGLPTAVVEAALCRTLIVGTGCTGNEDVIFPDKTGILTKPGDPESCAAGLEKALKLLNTEEEERFTREAEALCLNFSLKNNTTKLKELYNTGNILN